MGKKGHSWEDVGRLKITDRSFWIFLYPDLIEELHHFFPHSIGQDSFTWLQYNCKGSWDMWSSCVLGRRNGLGDTEHWLTHHVFWLLGTFFFFLNGAHPPVTSWEALQRGKILGTSHVWKFLYSSHMCINTMFGYKILDWKFWFPPEFCSHCSSIFQLPMFVCLWESDVTESLLFTDRKQMTL